MGKTPIILRLNKENYRKTARAQDLIIKELYKVFERAVLHGGTAIWRCYNGNRFSEDVDVYIPRDLVKIDNFFENLKKKGFRIIKKKISGRSIFSNLEFDRINVRFEAIFRKLTGELKNYETAEGNLDVVYTLSPENIITEKVEAYLKRLKIRDIYDIFFLLRYVDDKAKIKEALKKLIDKFKEPIDEKELKVLIIEGVVPDIEKILDYIRNYLKY